MKLYHLDLDRHFLPRGRVVVGVTGCPDFDLHYVSAALQFLPDGDLAVLLADLEVLPVALLAFPCRNILECLLALPFLPDLDHLGCLQDPFMFLQFPVFDLDDPAFDLQGIGCFCNAISGLRRTGVAVLSCDCQRILTGIFRRIVGPLDSIIGTGFQFQPLDGPDRRPLHLAVVFESSR